MNQGRSAQSTAQTLSVVVTEALASVARPQTGKVTEIDFRKDPRYRRFVESHPDALVFHQTGWLNALEAESEMPFVILGYQDEGGTLEAVLPLMRTRGLAFNVGSQQTGRRLACLPRTPAAGPVFTHEAAAVALLEAAVERALFGEDAQLQIKCERELPVDQVQGLISTDWRPTHVLAIPQNQADLRFGDARNRHNLKWAVKKAKKNGLRVRFAETESELRRWYPLYLQTMRRNVVPPRPLRFFLALWEELAPRGMMQLHLAEQIQGKHRRLVAGSVFLRFGETIWYAFTGAADKYLPLHSNDLVLWEAIHNACGTGARWMDLGEVSEDHPELERFKTKWGARPKKQYRYYAGMDTDTARERTHLHPHTGKFFVNAWQHLPLPITASLGNWIYCRL